MGLSEVYHHPAFRRRVKFPKEKTRKDEEESDDVEDFGDKIHFRHLKRHLLEKGKAFSLRDFWESDSHQIHFILLH